MKKNLFLIALFILTFSYSCKKDAFWNDVKEIPVTQKGTIKGIIRNNDNNTPIQGLKVILQRSISKNEISFVDTVSTDADGTFSLAVTFPNIVKISIKDTSRYTPDFTTVEVLAHKDYPIELYTQPKYGVANLKVRVLNKVSTESLAGVKVALLLRETLTEDYAVVDTIVSDHMFWDYCWSMFGRCT